MAFLEIPVLEDNFRWVQETTLDGVRFLLHFSWNEREGAWYVSLHDVDDNPIATGARIVANWFLFLRKVDTEVVPAGRFFVADTTGSGVDPGKDELGERVKLIYIEAEDAAAIGAGG